MFWAEFAVDVVRVSGADALTYLQGQISQEIRDLSIGESRYTFVLQPTGKVDSLARITRVGDDVFDVDTDAGFGEALLARLNRFKIRVKLDLAVVPSRGIAVRGATSRPAEGRSAWGRDDAYDLVDESVAPPADVPRGTAAALELARIETAWPAMGREITDSTIPAETGIIAHAVNFTKGCYPGQELVERMDSRGSTAPRLLRRLRGEGRVAPGAEVMHDGKSVGHVTSAATTAEGWVALALIARAVQPGDPVTVDGAPSTIE
jgi:folate-binding protein YgfZ